MYHSTLFDLSASWPGDNNVRMVVLHEVVEGLLLVIDLSTVPLPQGASRGSICVGGVII